MHFLTPFIGENIFLVHQVIFMFYFGPLNFYLFYFGLLSSLSLILYSLQLQT